MLCKAYSDPAVAASLGLQPPLVAVLQTGLVILDIVDQQLVFSSAVINAVIGSHSCHCNQRHTPYRCAVSLHFSSVLLSLTLQSVLFISTFLNVE